MTDPLVCALSENAILRSNIKNYVAMIRCLEAENARIRAALNRLFRWYRTDGSVSGCMSAFQEAQCLIEPNKKTAAET